ncbi:MAG: LptF/LptG family permease [Rhodospirillales bacterium]|nr:LptF/LptG family permease [Rhodospirillales bacterium]
MQSNSWDSMTRRLTRYIFFQLTTVVVLVTVTLTCAMWLTQSLRFIELIVNRGLSVGAYFYLTMLLLPTFLSVMLPVALFTAVIFLASGVVTIGYLLSLYLLPVSYSKFKDLEFNFRNDFSAILLREGVFNNVSPGITVYVRSREATGEMLGIMIYDNRTPEKPVTVLAERGTLAMTDEGPRVIMVNGNRQQVDRKEGKLSLLYFERYSVDLGQLGRSGGERWREPSERFLGELLSPGSSEADRVYAHKLRAEAHTRLTQPLYALAFVMIGLAAMLSGEFNRRGQTRRVLVAIGLVVVLQTAGIALQNAIVKAPQLTLLLYLLVLLAIGAAAWWLLRTPSRRRAEAWLPTG